jgi:hypothetical protein
VSRENFGRKLGKKRNADGRWGRRRATRVKGAAAEVEGYRHEGIFFFHCLAGGYGVEPGNRERVASSRSKKGDRWQTSALKAQGGTGAAASGRAAAIWRRIGCGEAQNGQRCSVEQVTV